MRGVTITIILAAWILALVFFFSKFITKTVGQEQQQSPLKSEDLFDEQRQKAEQAREDQRRLMENLQRKIREQRR